MKRKIRPAGSARNAGNKTGSWGVNMVMRNQARWLTAALVFLSLGTAHAAPLENQLRQHPSPYLALHGDDPVAWQEWNAASVDSAARRGEMLFSLSVFFFFFF